MSNNTKDRILEAALEIFARDGYVGTNLKDIAEAVGVVKSAFYRHFSSKEAVWNAVLDRMEAYYNERFGSTENLPSIPQSTDELKALTRRMLNFTICDEKIIMTRKILLTEQFHDARVRMLATEHFNIGLEALFTKIFEGMMARGFLQKSDPQMLAFAYTAPISTLVQLCDRMPEKQSEVMAKIEAFMAHFVEQYGKAPNDRSEKNMIETNRLKIFAASKEQMEAFIAAQSAEILKAAYTEMLNGCLSHPDQWEWYAIWMIELKDGTHIGELCFKGISEEGSTEIGYGIAAEHQGRGYATEAVSALAEWAFSRPGVLCVTAETEETNAHRLHQAQQHHRRHPNL